MPETFQISKDRKPVREPGLDWLRAGATVCVVALHAGIPYATHPLPGLVWSTYDPSPSLLIDAVVWNINTWVMPLFFLLSGYLASGLYHRLGPDGFARHRAIRLGGALLFGVCFILPLDLYAWMISWVNQGWVEPIKLKSLKIDGPLGEGMWGLSHLWYLQYLLIYSLLAVAALRGVFLPVPFRGSARIGEGDPELLKFPRFRMAASWGGSAAVTAMLLATAVVSLWIQPRILIGFRHSFFPQAANFVFFACWFVMGWQRANNSARGLSPLTRLVLGASGFALLWPMIRGHVEAESIPVASGVLPVLYVGVGWLLATGLFEGAVRLQIPPWRSVAFVAEASFWVYLLHHPVVGLTQGNLASASWPTEVKFLMALCAGLALPLLTYPVMVKETWVGALLNGRSRRRGSATAPPVDEPRQATRRAA
jgi:peptidoglycan/LPS O-acetylase OafA/YrhL